LPVEQVTWHDAQGFIKKLNALPSRGSAITPPLGAGIRVKC